MVVKRVCSAAVSATWSSAVRCGQSAVVLRRGRWYCAECDPLPKRLAKLKRHRTVLCDRLIEARNDLGNRHADNAQAVAYLAYLRSFIERTQTDLAKLDQQIQDIEATLGAEKKAVIRSDEIDQA